MFFRRPKPKREARRVVIGAPLRRRPVRVDQAEVEIVHSKLQASEPLLLEDDKALGFDPYNSKDKS
ncbi:MAG: hypothetical protein OEW35_08365 [Gammaproteobacteria bacterium]|nr:hypothetical protein [Gammaproteobacteria bacterium]MDH4255466.1 hypothetical protein [Gammaproteobacteria bacterium]MDH5309278.1 hypothetical protein [Gammaproteobacteria bacterium]